MQPTKEQVLADSTKVAQDAAKMLGGTFEQGKGFTPGTNVPISAIENNAPAPLAMPEMQLPQADIGGVRSAGQQIIDRDIAEKEAIAQQREVPVTETERRIQESYGILATEAPMRQMKEEKFGVNQYSQDLQKFQQTLRNQIAQLDQFDLNNTLSLERERIEAGKRGGTKTQFGNFSAEQNLQIAVQRAIAVAETRATIAGIEATRGNLQAATEQVDKALKAIYEPVRMGMQMEMFFLQRNDKRLDAAQSQLAQAKMMGMQYELGKIDRAEDMALRAVSEGFASPEEASQLATMDDPGKLLAKASQIIGKGNTEMRRLQVESMQIANWAKAEGVRLQQQALVDSKAAAERNAAIESDKLTMQLGSQFTNDERVKQFTITQQAHERFNATVSDRSQATYEAISGNNAAERALVTAYIRMTQPDIARSADGGDIAATGKITELVERTIAKATEDKGMLPRKIAEIATEVDNLYNASKQGLQSANQDWNSRLQSGTALPNLVIRSSELPDGLGSQIRAAASSGYSNDEIISFYVQNDPEIGISIKNAQEKGYSSSEIINYLLRY